MMLGGGLMMGLGLLFLLLVIAVPIVLVILLAGGTASFLQKRNEAQVVYQQPMYMTSKPVVPSDQTTAVPTGKYARNCAHCGAGLQADWNHCPQCGAPISKGGN